MKSSTKTAVITIGSIFLFFGVSGYFGAREFIRSIYRQRNCEVSNIDNIEMHAQVDIPDITYSDCHYDEDQHTKKAFFIIDTAEVDMVRYIRVNGFEKTTAVTTIDGDSFLNTQSSLLRPEDLVELYCKEGRYEEESWKLLLAMPGGKLWVNIKYQD